MMKKFQTYFLKIIAAILAAAAAPARAADPVTLTSVHDFANPGGDGTDGALPRGAALVLGRGKIMYGTTQQGGTAGEGTLYAITAAGSERVVHSFVPVPEGYGPKRNFVRDAAGNLYAALNGQGNYGRIVRITPAGTLSVLHTFTNFETEGDIIDNSLAIGTDGVLYGVTSDGGSDGHFCGTFFHLKTNGSAFTAVNFGQGAGNTGACDPTDGIVQGPDGNFYGIAGYEANGFNGGPGSIFQVTPAGVVTTIATITDYAMDTPLGTPVADQAGNLYFFAGGRGSSYGSVERFTPGIGISKLHQFAGTDGAPGPYTTRLLLHTDGRLYGTTSNGGANGGNASVYYNSGVAFSLGLDGSYEVLHNFGASSTDGQSPEAPLTAASDGSLWGTAPSGGANSKGVVFRLNKPSIIFGAHPSVIKAGKTATLTWRTTDTTDCTLDTGAGPAAVGTVGSVVVTPAATTSYPLVCHGAGTAQKTVAVKVM
jgi:uncharacterized repeat protein (TIGR03803 family)